MNHLTEQLRTIGNTLLHTQDYALLMDALHELHELCASITGIRASDVTDQDSYTATGKAISPIKAAHCLMEPERTRHFVRGVYAALNDLEKRFPDEPLRVLYAGTGPYSTLILPLLPLFSPEKLRLQLIDIHADCLDAVAAIYKSCDLEDFVEESYCTDAATFQTGEPPVHLLISETMQNALKREPQVAIMRNLVPQLAEGAVVVPQEITVEAWLLNRSHETRRLVVPGFVPERTNLGRVFSISKEELNCPGICLDIPVHDEQKSLHLLTGICVYGDISIGLYACSLTLPHRMPGGEGYSGKTLSFSYIVDGQPRLEYTLVPN
jgi:hypothetical protein